MAEVNGPHGHLRGQSEGRANVGVDPLLPSNLVGRVLPQGRFRQGVAGRIKPAHRGQERLGLRATRLEFY